MYSINTRGLNPGEAHAISYGVFNHSAPCLTPSECSGVDVPNPDTGFGIFWVGGRVADQHRQFGIEGLVTYDQINNDQVSISDAMDIPSAEIQMVIRTRGVASENALLWGDLLNT